MALAQAVVPQVVEDVWACCDDPKCEKWRRLPPGTQLDDKKKWYCYLNPDPLRNTCDAPEEEYDKEAESSIYFEAGEVVKTVNTTLAPMLPASKQLQLGDAGGRTKSGSIAVSGKRSGSKQRRSAQDAWRPHDDAGAAPGRGLGRVRKEHAGFQKVMQKGGVWEISKGRGRTVAQPPHWLWDGLASLAPEAAQLANEGVDVASAAAYFRGIPPNGEACAEAAVDASRLAMMAAAAMAAVSSGQLLEADAGARFAGGGAAAQPSGARHQQRPLQQAQQQQQQPAPAQHRGGDAAAAAVPGVSAQQPAPPWPLQPGLMPPQWPLPAASLAQMAAALAASQQQMALGHPQHGQQQAIGQMQLPGMPQLLQPLSQPPDRQPTANGLPVGSTAGSAQGSQAMPPAPGLLPGLGAAGMAAISAPFQSPLGGAGEAMGMPWRDSGASNGVKSAAAPPEPLHGPAVLPPGMSAPAQTLSPGKQGSAGQPNGRTAVAGS